MVTVLCGREEGRARGLNPSVVKEFLGMLQRPDRLGPLATLGVPQPPLSCCGSRHAPIRDSRSRASRWRGLRRAGARSQRVRFERAAARLRALRSRHRTAAHCTSRTLPSPSPRPPEIAGSRVLVEAGAAICVPSGQLGSTAVRTRPGSPSGALASPKDARLERAVPLAAAPAGATKKSGVVACHLWPCGPPLHEKGCAIAFYTLTLVDSVVCLWYAPGRFLKTALTGCPPLALGYESER